MTARVITALGQWSQRPGPLHARLTAALHDAIARGELADGARLPAERALARMLAVSRGTVAVAYAALAREGMLEGRRGSGTFVCPSPVSRALPERRAVAARLPRVVASAADELAGAGTIELSSATALWLDVLSDELLEEAMADPAVVRGHGYAPLGIPSFRRAVARWLTNEGLPTDERQIVVTTGAQQAIVLIAALYLRRGDRAVIEDPTYTGAIDALASAGARPLTVPVDADGARPDVLRSIVESEPVRLVYLVPTFHNPTGTVLSLARRREIVRLAQDFDLPVVDDITMTGLWLDRPPPPPLAAVGPEAPILTVGSLSKLFWGGLRLGWIRAPEELVPTLARLKAVADLGSSVVSQALGAALLARADEVAALRRSQLSSSTALLSGLLSRLLPDWSFDPPSGGVSLWVRLPYGDSEEFAQLAARHGVLVLPGNVSSAENRHRDQLRLPFFREPGELEEGVRRLASAWAVYSPELDRDRPELLRVVV